MNDRVLTRDKVRQVDTLAIEKFGMLGLVLMENAARGAVDFLTSAYLPSPIILVCGKGNNAGDGYAMARHLENRGWPVKILQLFPKAVLVGDALANWKIAQAAGIPTDYCLADEPGEVRERVSEAVEGFAIIVDCMLGTGAIGAPRFPLDTVISVLNEVKAIKIAVDIPSGFDCDTGEAFEPCFQADHTLTFVGLKPGFLRPGTKQFVGASHVIDIGVPRKLLDEL